MGTVSADNDTNDSFNSAEEIGVGTHSGSVEPMGSDLVDWYKFSGMGDHEVTVSIEVQDPGPGEYVSVSSYETLYQPDGQIFIYASVSEPKDTCHWNNVNETGTMYLEVTGTGDYKLKISIEDDDKGSNCPFVIGGVVIGVLVLLVVGAIIGNKVMKK